MIDAWAGSYDVLIGTGTPDEWTWLQILLFYEAVDGRLEIDDRMEYAVLQA